MGKETQEKLDVLDILIMVLQEHEKNLDEMLGNLTLAVTELTKTVDSLKKRNAVMLKYYQPINKSG